VPVRLRWIAVIIFSLSSVLNYLDRQVLATMADVWERHGEFSFNSSDYGLLLSVFSVAYALSAPFMGWFLDRVGLNRGIAFSVGLWALASFGTASSHNLTHLLAWRFILGVAEASGISSAGKMAGMYLKPEERAVGGAVCQFGLSAGAGLAPRFTIFFAEQSSWRWAFGAAGIASLLWIPIWLLTAKAIPPAEVDTPRRGANRDAAIMLRDGRLWALVFANMLSMTIYSLWISWSPKYLVLMQGMTPKEASHYSWVVPLWGYVGAFLGGSLSWRLIKRGVPPVESRKRACLWAAVVCLSTFAIPFTTTPFWATAGMSLSYFCVAAWSTNLYTIPVDLYGAGRAAFGVAAQVFAYGTMQAIISVPMGNIINQYHQRGFAAICYTFAFLPLAAYLVLALFVKERDTVPEVVATSSGV
jgi:ACS family hexuronate transporter-like MFS transporter